MYPVLTIHWQRMVKSIRTVALFISWLLRMDTKINKILDIKKTPRWEPEGFKKKIELVVKGIWE